MNKDYSQTRIPELDGLRGLAIFSVVAFHYVSQEGTASGNTAIAFLQRVVVMGWTGVDLFFVLSGFLIGGILLSARESPSYFKTFYARRFFRIIPIYYLWVTAYVLLVLLAGAKVQSLSNSGNALPLNSQIFSYYVFLQNFDSKSIPGIAGAWFGHLWSLAVEEQFYLVAPLVIRFLAPRRLRTALILAILVVPLFRTALLFLAGASPQLVTILMPSRADALGLGMLLALLWSQEDAKKWLHANTSTLQIALGIASLAAAALWLWSPYSASRGMQTAGYTVLALFYGLLLLLALTHHDGLLARAMRIRWLRELGRVSYTVYIIHLVVNVGCHAVILHHAPRISTLKGAVVTLFAALLTYALAALSWRFFEHPLLKKGHAFKY